MEKKENLEIKNVPEELTAEDLEKVNGGVTADRDGDYAMTNTDWNRDYGMTITDLTEGVLSRP